MTVISKLKFLFSVLLICCLFLPLSQCTKFDARGNAVVKENYMFKSKNKFDSWVGAVAMVAPFAFLLVTFRIKSKKILVNLISLPIFGLAFYVVFITTIFSLKILIAGYIALFSSASLLMLAFIDIGFILGAASRREGSPPQ